MGVKFLDQILEAARVGETTDWEFKSGRGGFPGSFWETYSAMANTEGGTIILGVREKSGTLRFDGLTPTQIKDYQKILWDGLNNRGKVNHNLLTVSDVQKIIVSEKNLLTVQVPRASRHDRPIYIGPTPFGHTYRRQHEGDYRCADEEVRRMLADSDPTPADHRILDGFDIEDLDPASLTQYRTRFSATKPDHPWLALPILDFLERLGAWRKDRNSIQKGITLAGLMMFGRYQAITDSEAAPQFFVDYREKFDPVKRWTDRLYPDGSWETNLFQFYQRVWPKLISDLRVPFRLEGAQRKDETPVHEALREALVNALIHTDYSAPGGVVVEHYRDRFVIENPGTLLISIDQLRRGGVSECRNKALQQMFIMIGGGERAGSGFDRIQSGWRSQHWRAPALSTQFHPDRVRLVLPMVSLIPAEVLKALQERIGKRFQSLTKPEVQALATAYLEGEVSNVRLQELLTDHPVDITHILQGLCSRGFLESDYRRRWARYRLAQPALTGRPTPNSIPLPPDSILLNGDSIPSAILDEDIHELAESVAGRKKVSPTQMREVIIKLCDGRYLSTERLSQILKRNSVSLRHRFLTPMVREGILLLRYPEAPNNPGQAYRSVRKKS